MILDCISNSDFYNELHPFFKKGFDFIKTFNPNNYIEGKNEISGDDIFAIVAHLKNFEVNNKLEVHNKYIDIQYVVKGCDKIGWKNRQECKLPENEFDKEKDYQFYLDKSTSVFDVKKEEFVIFYPNDAHAPLMNNEELLKIVIKIKHQF